MTRRIVEVILAATLVFAGTANNALAATPLPAAAQQRTPDATDLGASRRARHHHHYASRGYYRPSQPFYYDRPYYYAPAPFVPFNFGYTVPWW
jgi:hypothetical protein